MRGARLDASPGGWEAVQCEYQPRESTASHRFTRTIHHLLTTSHLQPFAHLYGKLAPKCSYELLPDVQIQL